MTFAELALPYDRPRDYAGIIGKPLKPATTQPRSAKSPQRKQPSAGAPPKEPLIDAEQICHALLMYVLPFCYGAITRLPFIYLVLQLRGSYRLDWEAIGLAVAAYQFARVLTNAMAMKRPRTAHWWGNSCGVVGSLFTDCE